MKIVIKVTDGTEENDYQESYEILIDGKSVLSVYDGEPEDNNLSRNFNDVHGIPDILKTVYDADRKDEAFSLFKHVDGMSGTRCVYRRKRSWTEKTNPECNDEKN